MKSLVLYYSRTGKTRFVAEKIAAELGSDVEEIIDLKNRSGKIGWIIGGKDASQKKLTTIAPVKQSVVDYDLIIIGTPIWAWAPTPAVRTYLSQNNLSGKRVALFYTFDSDIKKGGEKTKAMLTNAIIVDELSIANLSGKKDEAERKIADWCQRLKQLYT